MGPITANSKIHESDTVIPRVLGGLLVLVGVLIVSCALWMVWGISAERADRQAGRSYTEADEPMLEAERETFKHCIIIEEAHNILSASAKEDLDKLAGSLGADKRFVISVEGYTDKTGDRAYNEALSRKRADAVVTYLVSKHNVPIFRVHMIGLADEKPVDEGKDRAARAKNRRVEVKVFTADVDAATGTAATRQE